MSLVPYQADNKVVLHDPALGIVVLHNDQQNTIELLSTSRAEPHNALKCPNCGYVLNGRAPGELYPTTVAAGVGDRRGSHDRDPLAPSWLPVGIDEEFTSQDYFRLLGDLMPLEGGTPLRLRTRSGDALLPESIFNQGYFERFFRKVPPYILGSGAHAQVYKVVHVLNAMRLGTYAVKRICIGDKVEFLQQVLNEVMILYELSLKGANENNLIRYNHVWLEMGDINDLPTFILPSPGGARSRWGSRVPYVYILQQYCAGGHLEGLIVDRLPKRQLSERDKVEQVRRQRRERRSSGGEPLDPPRRPWLNEIEIWKFFRDVTNGVHYLHSHGILHRDLKPSNCLLDVAYEGPHDWDLARYIEQLPKVLVTDFGEGRFVDKRLEIDGLDTVYEGGRRGNTGTLEFTAPELWVFTDPHVAGSAYAHEFTFDSDVYSLGLILCWLSVGELPFTEAIAAELDPLVIRDNISRWYFSETRETFGAWFRQRWRHRHSSSAARGAFQELIYNTIKGPEAQRLTTGQIMARLDEIEAVLNAPPQRARAPISSLNRLMAKYDRVFSVVPPVLAYLVLELGSNARWLVVGKVLTVWLIVRAPTLGRWIGFAVLVLSIAVVYGTM